MEFLALFHRHGDATKLGGLVSLFAVSADSFCVRLLRDTLELGGVFAISAAARTMQSVLCTIIAGQDATVATVVPSRPAFHIAARGKAFPTQQAVLAFVVRHPLVYIYNVTGGYHSHRFTFLSTGCRGNRESWRCSV